MHRNLKHKPTMDSGVQTPASAAPLPANEEVANILDWLANPPPALADEHLAALRDQLLQLPIDADASQFQRLLDLLFVRLQKLAAELQSSLAGAPLPLSRETRQRALTVMQAHRLLADGYTRLLDTPPIASRQVQRTRLCAGRGLKNLLDEYETACLTAAPAAPGLWLCAHKLYLSAHAKLPDQEPVFSITHDPEKIYRQLLALAATQPETLAPSDLQLAADYLTAFASAVRVSFESGTEPGGCSHWVDLSRDQGPVSSLRRAMPTHSQLAHVSFLPLSQLAAQQLSALAHGTPADQLHLPSAATGEDFRLLLKRLSECWSVPARRHFSRRRNSYRVILAAGINDIWAMLGEPADRQTGHASLSEWMVVNESATGYGAMHVSGEIRPLRPGGLVALRGSEDSHWILCVVRWLRSENPEHMELGLETIGLNAIPVHIAFRSGRSGDVPVKALLLPPLGQLRPRASVIAPRGSTIARRFILMHDRPGHLAISQGCLREIDLQTSGVELFQFDPDPAPL